MSTSETPGSSMTTRSLPWTTTTGSDTPVVFTRRSMMSLMTPIASGSACTPSLGSAWYSTRSPPSRSRPSLVSISRHWPSARRRVGQAEAREEVDEEGEDADDDDEDGAGSAHTGGMLHGTSPDRRRRRQGVAVRDAALRPPAWP